jgi:hypothetical protein
VESIAATERAQEITEQNTAPRSQKKNGEFVFTQITPGSEPSGPETSGKLGPAVIVVRRAGRQFVW